MKCILVLTLVVLVTCGSVSGDLEFYPGYKRSDIDLDDVTAGDWSRESHPNYDLQQYLQDSIYRPDTDRSPYSYGGLRRQKPHQDPTWSNTIANHLLTNKDLAMKLLHRNPKLQEPTRKHQYFKILPSGRDPNARVNRLINDKEANALLALFKPSYPMTVQHLQEDPDELSDFDFVDEDEDVEGGDVSEKHEELQEVEQKHHVHDYEADHTEEERSSNPSYDLDTVYNPNEFAFAPSDPRYFKNGLEVVVDTGTLPSTTDPEYYMRDIAEETDLKDQNSSTFMQERNSQGEESADVVTQKSTSEDDTAGVYIIAVVAGISAAATVGLIAFGIGWYNLQKHVKNASDVDYPAYGVTGPNKDISPSGDRRLAQSAQMYHYQHQKQQIIAMERAAANERHGSVSEADSDEENEEGDYTVYECPGLAPTGEMEVKNPLFQDDPTPAQTPAVRSSENGGAVPKK